MLTVSFQTEERFKWLLSCKVALQSNSRWPFVSVGILCFPSISSLTVSSTVWSKHCMFLDLLKQAILTTKKTRLAINYVLQHSAFITKHQKTHTHTATNKEDAKICYIQLLNKNYAAPLMHKSWTKIVTFLTRQMPVQVFSDLMSYISFQYNTHTS